MSANADYLKKHGWLQTSRRRMGMVIIERWCKPGTDWSGCSQSQALQIERAYHYKTHPGVTEKHPEDGRITTRKPPME